MWLGETHRDHREVLSAVTVFLRSALHVQTTWLVRSQRVFTEHDSTGVHSTSGVSGEAPMSRSSVWIF